MRCFVYREGVMFPWTGHTLDSKPLFLEKSVADTLVFAVIL